MNNTQEIQVINKISRADEIFCNTVAKQTINTLIENTNVGDVEPLKIIIGITDLDKLYQHIIDKVTKPSKSSNFDEYARDYIEQMNCDVNLHIKNNRVIASSIAVLTVDYVNKLFTSIGLSINRLITDNEKVKIIYLFNGKHWFNVNDVWLKSLLQGIIIKLGYDCVHAQKPGITNMLINTFYNNAAPTPEYNHHRILINLNNTTLEIMPNGEVSKRVFNKDDFLQYCLSYDYAPDAKADLFIKYLNRVLPDKDSQNVLQELIGSAFIKSVNLEKIGILLGSGSNGKSVFMNIITALLGENNISSMDLKSLTTDRNADNNRSHLMGKLLNFAPEINAKGEQSHDLIKRMASGEAVQAKLLYQNTFTISNYAKLVFNANSLPTDVEHTHGFFRRWLIIDFNQTIDESEKDPYLAKKIIDKELAGVLNWVIEGAKRIQKNKSFSKCTRSDELLAEYQKESDVVALWVDAVGYISHDSHYISLKDLYDKFRNWASSSGYVKIPVDKTVAKRLENLGFKKRKGKPTGFYIITKTY